jgi:pimeloyl-ACP methyl ester carboxylesterase
VRSRRRGGPLWLFVAAVVVTAAACSPPVRVVRQNPREVHRALTANVLTSGGPSPATHAVLIRRGLERNYEQHPEQALAWLHAVAASPSGQPDDLFALAELSFLEGERSGDRSRYRAAAIYAWLFLFPDDPADRPNPFDPRLRVAADVYNRAVTMGFPGAEPTRMDVRAGSYPLPWGTLEVSFDEEDLTWGDRRLDDFVAVADFGVEGLDPRYRRPGIGAPLAASTLPRDPDDGVAQDLVSKRVKVPVTAVLRVTDGESALSPRARARMEIHAASEAGAIEIAGEEVPLEIEPTSSLAYMLTEARPWERELRAFILGDLLQQQKVTALGALEPHRRGRIPVVLVHGTASSPARWADMLNELENAPDIRAHFEFWFFTYDSGNPIPYSALLLRRALSDAVREIDPAGEDPCLRQMVVIGHSQGGLLAKMTVIDSGDRLWRNLSRVPLEELDLTPDERELLREGMFVEPQPDVSRVIFISTPHRGSYLTGGFVNALVGRLVSLPGNLVRLGTSLLTRNRSLLARADFDRLPTSVDNMSPSNPLIQSLAEMSPVPGVASNSIVAVSGEGPLADDGDGVVAYSSAHREDVESEVVVLSGHSAQSNPLAIEEVRRILLLHASLVAEGRTCRARPGGSALVGPVLDLEGDQAR